MPGSFSSEACMHQSSRRSLPVCSFSGPDHQAVGPQGLPGSCQPGPHWFSGGSSGQTSLLVYATTKHCGHSQSLALRSHIMAGVACITCSALGHSRLLKIFRRLLHGISSWIPYVTGVHCVPSLHAPHSTDVLLRLLRCYKPLH